jgi:hypothetical protein
MRTSPLARFSKAAIGRTKSHQIAGDRYKIGKIRTWSTEASLKDITSKNDRDLSDYHLETKSTAQKPISNISVSGDEVMGVGCHGKYLGDEHVPSSFSNGKFGAIFFTWMLDISMYMRGCAYVCPCIH